MRDATLWLSSIGHHLLHGTRGPQRTLSAFAVDLLGHETRTSGDLQAFLHLLMLWTPLPPHFLEQTTLLLISQGSVLCEGLAQNPKCETPRVDSNFLQSFSFSVRGQYLFKVSVKYGNDKNQ